MLNPVTIVNDATSPIPVSINIYELTNAQTGTTYTILSSDWGKLVTLSNGSAIAVTLPEADSSSFPDGFWFDIVNLGAGTATITPTTSTIQGQATAVLRTGDAIRVVSDGSDYWVQNGGIPITGAKIFGTMPRIPSATVAAAGSVQGDAAAIVTGFTLVTAANGTKGVVLPTAVAGLVAIVKNGAAAVLKVYPAASDAINGLSANASLDMADNTSALLVAYDATTWYTVPLLPS